MTQLEVKPQRSPSYLRDVLTDSHTPDRRDAINLSDITIWKPDPQVLTNMLEGARNHNIIDEVAFQAAEFNTRGLRAVHRIPHIDHLDYGKLGNVIAIELPHNAGSLHKQRLIIYQGKDSKKSKVILFESLPDGSQPTLTTLPMDEASLRDHRSISARAKRIISDVEHGLDSIDDLMTNDFARLSEKEREEVIANRKKTVAFYKALKVARNVTSSITNSFSDRGPDTLEQLRIFIDQNTTGDGEKSGVPTIVENDFGVVEKESAHTDDVQPEPSATVPPSSTGANFLNDVVGTPTGVEAEDQWLISSGGTTAPDAGGQFDPSAQERFLRELEERTREVTSSSFDITTLSPLPRPTSPYRSSTNLKTGEKNEGTYSPTELEGLMSLRPLSASDEADLRLLEERLKQQLANGQRLDLDLAMAQPISQEASVSTPLPASRRYDRVEGTAMPEIQVIGQYHGTDVLVCKINSATTRVATFTSIEGNEYGIVDVYEFIDPKKHGDNPYSLVRSGLSYRQFNDLSREELLEWLTGQIPLPLRMPSETEAGVYRQMMSAGEKISKPPRRTRRIPAVLQNLVSTAAAAVL